jgi:hypothetical protein
LTPEEHYLAHQLLVKIYPKNRSLINAAVMMIANRPSNKLYGWLRRKFAENQSESQTGEGNSQFGSRWIHNVELKQNRKLKKSEPLPTGWTEGRRLNFDLKFYSCRTCSTRFERTCLEIYCSEVCKRHDKSEAIKLIDNNLDEMIQYYQTVWSIDKTLKNFNIKSESGSGRAGNRYFSSILKSKDIYVRRRRNSSQSIRSDAPDL